MSKDLVVKANALIEAGYQLTTNEQRLILSAIACIPKGEPIDPNVGYCVSKRNFVNLGVNPKTANREIREACDRLFSRYVTIKTEQGEFKTRWVQDIMKYDKDWAEYNREFFIETIGEDPDEDDCILAAITFSRSVIPYLTELKSNFTQYMLSDVKRFSSAYSFRIFEFMMQFKATGFIKIGLKEFRQRLDLGDKYPATKDLRVYVIDTAIKEINEKSPYTAKYDLLKTGRKITHLELRFKPKAKAIEHKIERDPDTIDWVNGTTDNEANNNPTKPSWQTKGLSDAQIKKLAIYTKEFVDANSSKIAPNDRRDYTPIFDDWKPLLKDPSTVNSFHMIQELLERQRIT